MLSPATATLRDFIHLQMESSGWDLLGSVDVWAEDCSQRIELQSASKYIKVLYIRGLCHKGPKVTSFIQKTTSCPLQTMLPASGAGPQKHPLRLGLLLQRLGNAMNGSLSAENRRKNGNCGKIFTFTCVQVLSCSVPLPSMGRWLRVIITSYWPISPWQRLHWLMQRSNHTDYLAKHCGAVPNHDPGSPNGDHCGFWFVHARFSLVLYSFDLFC